MKLFVVRNDSRGFSLVIVFVIVAVALMILAGVMGWVASSGSLTARYREYHTSLGAAEAGTEKVIATMARDFQAASERSDFQGADLTTLDGNVATYEGQPPPAVELSEAANYEFAGPTLGTDATYVARVADRNWTNLIWKYTNFNGYATTYRVVSNARNTDSDNNIVSAFRQDIQLASIPLFGFAIFYGGNNDLEFCPISGNLNIDGPVHSDGSIYSKPNAPTMITYSEAVTASGTITNESSPSDPTARTLGTVVYGKEKDVRVSPLNLPIGMPNTSSNLHQIIEIPPIAESPTSALGQQRYYNKADLIILVTNTNVAYYHGAADPSPYIDSITNLIYGTNVLRIDGGTNFYNSREAGMIRFTEFDVSLIASSPISTTVVGHTPTIVYIADRRTPVIGSESGVRVINASALPASGLTIATPNPLYVKGDFNTSVPPRPASLVADAITVLSGNWNDANSTNSYTHAAINTTINAGVIAGIVPSNGAAYSGGVENVFRLLENWSSKIFTLNGSIVVLFSSQIATAPWGANFVYSPPTRTFSFNPDFRDDYTKLPPGTPNVRTLIRDQRVAIQPNSTQ